MKARLLVVIVILVSISLKLYLASTFYGNYDQESYELVVKIIKNGQNIYHETERYNYTPAWSWILVFLDSVSNTLNIQFHTVIRAFLTIADALNMLLIGLIASKIRPNGYLLSILCYALNPVPLLIIGYHGQFDCLALLPMLLAVYIGVSLPNPPKYLIWILGTLALLIKHTTFFGVWILFAHTSKSNKKAILMFFSSLVVFVFSFIPYLPEGLAGILQNVFLYRGMTGFYGLSLLLPKVINYGLFFTVMVSLPLLVKNLRDPASLVKSLELSFVSFITTTPGIGQQYFLLPIVWGSINPTRWYLGFTLFASVYVIATTLNLHATHLSLVGHILI